MTIATDSQAWRPRDALALRFKMLRAELALSQRELAERVGIPASQIQSIEDGKSPRNLDIKVNRIALALNVDRDWLMWGGPLEPEVDLDPNGGDGASCRDRTDDLPLTWSRPDVGPGAIICQFPIRRETDDDGRVAA